jgi:hypothetical protein
MKRSTRSAAVVLAALLLLPASGAAVHGVSWDENGLNYFFATERDTYTMYENIPIWYTVTNTSGDTMLIEHPCQGLGGISFSVWTPVWQWHPVPTCVWGCCGCFDVMWVDEFGPGETYNRQVTWDMYQFNGTLIPHAGSYRLDGEFRAWTYPENVSLCHAFSLYVEILPCPTIVPDETGSWGTIKALYR